MNPYDSHQKPRRMPFESLQKDAEFCTVPPVLGEGLACVEWGLGRAFGGCCNKEGLGFKSFKGREGWAGV